MLRSLQKSFISLVLILGLLPGWLVAQNTPPSPAPSSPPSATPKPTEKPAETPAPTPIPEKHSPSTGVVPFMIGVGAAASLTGIILSMDALNRKSAMTEDNFLVSIGTGLGLAVGGGIFMMLGVSAGNADMDYKRVAPEESVVKPALGPGFLGLKIIPGQPRQ